MSNYVAKAKHPKTGKTDEVIDTSAPQSFHERNGGRFKGQEPMTPQQEAEYTAKPAINRIERDDIEAFRNAGRGPSLIPNAMELYQRIATKSAIYPGKGTPFGLMYAALGLAEAGEVQNKVKKAFRDDDILMLEKQTGEPGEEWYHAYICELTPERRAQIIKELGGVLWYIAAVCDEIGATMSEVALQNLEELCSRGERGTLRGDGDNR